MRDLIILGAGPAGLAASAYAIRKRLDVLVIASDLGGKTNYPFALPWLDDYQVIRGKEIVANFRRELEYIDFAYLRDTAKHVDADGDSFLVHTGSGGRESCSALIVATGATRVPLDVPGEEKFLSRGIGYSAVSYSHLFIDRTVFLTGNGQRLVNSAFDCALHAGQVIVNVESGSGVSDGELARLDANERVTLLRDGVVTEFRGKDYAQEAIVRFEGDREETFEADGFFIEREPVPASLSVADLVELDEHGQIVVDRENATSRRGVFAAGDVTSGRHEQVLIALGEGARAALAASDYLLTR